MDKLPKEDRIKWIDENMGNIRESAINPHKENAWWMNSENPWQTLALCKEFLKIDKYLLMGGDIEMYKCRIPIHQDGSCNGLQHYAALGLDLEGGKAVNLVPMKDGKRQDIYSTVLNLVENQVRKDCVNKTNDIAQISLPLLSRKIVKQTVMTSVYGVTRFGAYQQIKNRIKETLINGDVNKVVQYLTDLTLQSITKLFSKAKLIQNWLIMSSLRVIMSFDHETIEFKKVNSKTGLPDFFDDLFYKPMMWTSLSGLPIVQTYKKHKYHNLRTSTGTLKLKDHATVKEINLRKQKNGIAPNFIHSIDSIHLQMTCLKANREGLGFAAVHDSFWTYPNDVDSLSKIIREEFVTLHTSNIIENLRQDLLYTTRNSLQLVYIHKTNDSKFHSKLRTMRQARIGNILKGKLSKQELNEILYLESKDLLKSANSFKDQYYQLIDSCKPKLYFPISKNKMMIYSSNPKIQDIEENKITFLNYEPLLVPVKILHCPPKGHLNISHVRENKYFFS